MSYIVKEIFYTLQGEGRHTGRPAVFCRFSGCNLWSGKEEHRKTSLCQFCDTDFVGTNPNKGGGKYSLSELVDQLEHYWPHKDSRHKFVVCTGGEPLLQLDQDLIDALHDKNFYIAVETNGTINTDLNIDWITVSPKVNAPLFLKKGNELKVVVPQDKQDISQYEDLEFDYFFIQPMDNENIKENTKTAIHLVMSNPQWNLSLQTHKILEID